MLLIEISPNEKKTKKEKQLINKITAISTVEERKPEQQTCFVYIISTYINHPEK